MTLGQLWHSAVTGALMLVLHFGAVYAAFQLGAQAGAAALVIGAMPLVVALIVHMGGIERLRTLQWSGMAPGSAGVVLVVMDRVDGARPLRAWCALLVGLMGISLGTLYQKRHAAQVDARAGLTAQHLAARVLLVPLAVRESFRCDVVQPSSCRWSGWSWSIRWVVSYCCSCCSDAARRPGWRPFFS